MEALFFIPVFIVIGLLGNILPGSCIDSLGLPGFAVIAIIVVVAVLLRLFK